MVGTGWGALVNAAVATLSESGVDSPRADAEFMAAHVAGVSRTGLHTAADPAPEAVNAYRELVSRRAERQPLQHVLGTAPFRYGELAVGPGVFVPRPETELLVEWALPRLAVVDAPLVVDLCAGSGAIGHAIVHERPDARVVAVELSPEALPWLERNLSGSGVRVVAADATDPATLSELDGRVDAVLSNPPYVPAAVPVSPEVAADPAMAVFSGADGLAVIRALIPRAAALLRPGGLVAVEHDDTHGSAVPELLRASGFTDVTGHRDLTGRPRFATATRPATTPPGDAADRAAD